jgi:hypothetical protein
MLLKYLILAYYSFTTHTLCISLNITHGVPGKMAIICEVTESVILSKTVYTYMCAIPNDFRDKALSLCRRATRHVVTRVAKCTDADGGIFENVLY